MFSDYGIPDDHSVIRLHCHEAGRFFVAHTSYGSSPALGSVWARRFDDKRYVELRGEDQTGISSTEIALHYSKPLISINKMVHSPSEDVNGVVINGFNWNSLEVFDLETGRLASKLDEFVGKNRRWVSDVFGWSCEADVLLAKMGIETSEAEGILRTDYWLCRLCPRSGDYEKITRLEGVFV